MNITTIGAGQQQFVQAKKVAKNVSANTEVNLLKNNIKLYDGSTVRINDESIKRILAHMWVSPKYIK